MKAMLIEENKLVLRDIPEPVLKPGYVIIDIHAAALNRADLLQVAGKYPPPPGWPEWPGLECSGVISAANENSRWKAGDKVCALLGGGGYAEKVLVPEGMVMPIPDNVSFAEAAALPEVYTTAMLNLFRLGELKKGETLFVQAGASGLGIAAIQLGKLAGAKVVTTVGSPEKAEAVRKLGADVVIDRKAEAVDEVLLKHPVDVALDCAGGALLGKCLHAVNPGGRWLLVSTLGGETTELPLRVLLKKHIRLMGSTLRSRSDAEKSDILKQLTETVWPEVSSGKIRPVIHAVFPFENAAKAHEILAAQQNTGKVVLTLK
ncbi:MAG: NAD(P)H-quinone oxidoreductase [Lentisphaeria bacterium]|nr:NAD(P)H-quinone oxidoreductase [Lentisphaeria bacterium]